MLNFDLMLTTGPERPRHTLVLAHGAGAPMDSPFMDAMASGLAARDIRVLRFEFPYMHRRREDGKKRGPDRGPMLQATWKEVIAEVGTPARLVIGGKSMGGRIASMVADELGVRGLVCLGYPFHPPGRPTRTRTKHLEQLETPTLILQGTRDALGTAEDVAGYELSPKIRVHWLRDGDHSFEPRKKSGRTNEQNLNEAVESIAAFLDGLR